MEHTFDNINSFNETADSDQCGDETSWGHARYSGVTGRVHQKPNVSKGGQTVITCDVSRNYPRVYCHRHNYMEHPEGVTAKGQAEVIKLAKKVEEMVMTEGVNDQSNLSGKKKILKVKPCFTFDNYFFW